MGKRLPVDTEFYSPGEFCIPDDDAPPAEANADGED